MASKDLRLRGQEVELRMFTGGVLEDSLLLVASFDETFKLEKKEDGFLGERTNRYDDIFNGVDGKLDVQVNSAAWMPFQQAIKARAQRLTPLVQFNLVRTDFYANGETAIVTYADVKFGPMSTSVAGRGEFVKVSIDFSCSDRTEQITTAL